MASSRTTVMNFMVKIKVLWKLMVGDESGLNVQGTSIAGDAGYIHLDRDGPSLDSYLCCCGPDGATRISGISLLEK